jgi:hypothetical protein
VTTLRRYVRQVIAPNGKHRPKPVLLPDEPIPPNAPTVRAHLTEAQLLSLFDDGEAAVLEGAVCPCCDRTTPHAVSRDSRRCWDCGTTTTIKGD